LVEFTSIRLPEMLSELRRGAWYANGTGTCNATILVSDSDEEVRRGLPIGGYVSHIQEVLLGLIGGPKVRHFPLIDDAYLVK
jgi:hypothetical protein